tara:strand:- start:283 stop:606 length:324 start_codon:yes stop_codon:yes gene_type:complete
MDQFFLLLPLQVVAVEQMIILVAVDNLAVQMDLQEDTAVLEVLVAVCQIQHQMLKVQVILHLYHLLKVILADQLLVQQQRALMAVAVQEKLETLMDKQQVVMACQVQ